MRSAKKVIDVTIASGGSLSGEAKLEGMDLVGVLMPAAWTAADLTFQISPNGNDFGNAYWDGSELTISGVDASRFVALDPAYFVGAESVKVRSGTAGTAVNQDADRTLKLVARGY